MVWERRDPNEPLDWEEGWEGAYYVCIDARMLVYACACACYVCICVEGVCGMVRMY